MLIATCHRQFHRQDLWFKYSMVLIVHDVLCWLHFMLTATLLKIKTTWQVKKASQPQSKAAHLNCCIVPLSAMERGLSHQGTKKGTEIWDCPFAPAQQAAPLKIIRRKGMEQAELREWQHPRFAPAEVALSWVKWWRNRFCPSSIITVYLAPSLYDYIQFIPT